MKAQEKEEVRLRIEALKPLPPHWKKEFAASYPEFNTISGSNKLSSVTRGFTSDISIVEKMEKLFGRHIAKKSKSKKEITR